MEVAVELFFFGQRVRDYEPGASQARVRHSLDDKRRLLLVLHRPVQRAPRVGKVEAREAEGAEAYDGHAHGLQVLQRRGNVEDGLDPGADDGHWRPGEGREVCGYVPTLARPPVHAAEAPRGEEPYPGERSEVRGGGDGGGPVARLRGGHGQVPRRELGDVRRARQELELRLLQPDLGRTPDDAYRRGHGAFGAHGTLRLAGDIQVFGAGQSVGDQGRLERHDGRSFSQGLPNVGPDLDAQAAGSMQRSSLLRGLLT